jgi:aspartokinase
MGELFGKSINDAEKKKKIIEILSKTGISAYTDVACISIKKTIESLRLLHDFLGKNSNPNDIIISAMGKNTITFLIPQKFINLTKSLFGSNLLEVEEKSGAIFLKCIKDVNSTHGITAFISSLFLKKKVNIYNLMSTYTDYVIIIPEKDTYMMADYLKKTFGC